MQRRFGPNVVRACKSSTLITSEMRCLGPQIINLNNKYYCSSIIVNKTQNFSTISSLLASNSDSDSPKRQFRSPSPDLTE